MPAVCSGCAVNQIWLLSAGWVDLRGFVDTLLCGLKCSIFGVETHWCNVLCAISWCDVWCLTLHGGAMFVVKHGGAMFDSGSWHAVCSSMQ